MHSFLKSSRNMLIFENCYIVNCNLKQICISNRSPSSEISQFAALVLSEQLLIQDAIMRVRYPPCHKLLARDAIHEQGLKSGSSKPIRIHAI
jgi:hypothetical protein